MTMRWPLYLVLSLAAFVCDRDAAASVDTSPKPGGIYKLKPGVFVAESVRCEAPANPDIREYDGRNISSLRDRGCRTRVFARKGSRYTVDQSCIDARGGTAARHTVRQQIVVRDALSFTQTIRGRSVDYRYCPVYQLPRGLQH
ncbi:hypothetical protein LK542_08315 [Massilia sp. IC2-477]|uniref:hypothetical protein n=1 Tax=unclassified Massilia TaxID=2609279 RepID=UPI001D12653E|nr:MULTISPECIES: hypothetical protein [unclassified Massilia]MCC2955614.1 hypothetical protein [Massilia sp. IC2-477]MCC2974366.1 hypothetical protein [Massilia sp. IC2-476]